MKKLFAAAVAVSSLSVFAQEMDQTLATRLEQVEKLSKMFSAKGHFQFRTESAENRRGTQDSSQLAQSFSRMRVYFQFSPNEKMTFNYTPQMTKGFGETDGGNVTSGSTNHTSVTSFESNIDYMITDKLSVKLGRQELSYGDHLFIGALPWDNAGRSFDAVKLRHTLKNGWVDVLHSKISNNSTNFGVGTEQDDKDMYLVYSSMKFDNALKELDLYLLHQKDNTGATDSDDTDLNMIGFRAKGKAGSVFFRTENAIQSGDGVGEDAYEDAYQYDVEVGGEFGAYKASVEYSMAGKDYQQLYPTAHKFMGIVDVLGRRNLQQTALHVKGKPMDKWNFNLDFHQFQRIDDEAGAYALKGATSLGTTGDSTDIGSEIDLVVNYMADGGLKVQLGYGVFTPGEYMEDNGLEDNVVFSYVQFLAKF